MRRAFVVGGSLLAIVLVVVAFIAARRAVERELTNDAAATSDVEDQIGDGNGNGNGNEDEDGKGSGDPSGPVAATDRGQGFLYGRVSSDEGITYEGRLRLGSNQEAFWSDTFHGTRRGNPWVAHVPPERLKEKRPIEVFGLQLTEVERSIDVRRPFVTRFGDIVRLEASGRDLRVTLKSGTVVELDRWAADDFADGLRIWDESGVVDLGERRIGSIELLPTPPLREVPQRLHGTVRTRQGDFTGFVQWDRDECVGTDVLDGNDPEGNEVDVRFDTIRSIARSSDDGCLVTLHDGTEIELAGTNDVSPPGFRGIFVDDRRYGRVLIGWDVFERMDTSEAGSGLGYDDFAPGRPLTGSVTTRGGRRLAGRLVYDLDENENTEALDAPDRGVNYSILFELIASIVPRSRAENGVERALVLLRSGEELRLEHEGDLADTNLGMLVFVDGGERAEHVPWSEVARIDFEPPQER